MPAALDGLKVIDMTQHLSGPYCTMILADMGADVIKVERPAAGDDSRDMPPFVAGESAPFMLWNRNKRSIALDLKAASDLEILRKLVVSADVFVENFRPGTAERLGLGYDALKSLNAGLIYASISGFGKTGPYQNRGGFDLMTQAMSGLMSVCGDLDGPPFRLPIAISDVSAGMFAAIGILSALAARSKTGKGERVDVSLFDSAVSMAVYEFAHLFATGEAPKRIGQAHRGGSPYQVFETKDGWITIGGATQALWQAFCAAAGLENLAEDPRFASNPDRVRNNQALVPLIAARLKEEGTDHWMVKMEEAGIPFGPVMTFDQVARDPQVTAREMVVPLQHPKAGSSHTLGTPIKLSRSPGGVRSPAPVLDQHRAEILAELSENVKVAE